MKDKPGFDEQYCSRHNQHYADFLVECPVCVGERMEASGEEICIEETQRKPVKPEQKQLW